MSAAYGLSFSGRDAHINPIELSKMGKMKDLLYIRSVMMNPLAAFESEDFYDKYFNLIGKIVNKALINVISTMLIEENNGERIKILWIENDNGVKNLKKIIETDTRFGHCFNIDFESYSSDTVKRVNSKDYVATIVDLNLQDENHLEHDPSKTEISFNLIREMKKVDKNRNVFVYSEFLSDDNPNRKRVTMDLLDIDQELHLSELNLIGKNKNEDGENDIERNKLSIIHAIFIYYKQTKVNKPLTKYPG